MAVQRATAPDEANGTDGPWGCLGLSREQMLLLRLKEPPRVQLWGCMESGGL